MGKNEKKFGMPMNADKHGELKSYIVCQKSVLLFGRLGQDSPTTAWGWNPQPRFNTKGLLTTGL
jgi:hypothetical protein